MNTADIVANERVDVLIVGLGPAGSAAAGSNWQHTLLYGALFGFFTYATYNLTNFATLRNWSLPLTLVDIAWGTIAAAVAAAISFMVVVFPAFGGDTIKPRCPIPIGAIRSMTRVVGGNLPVSNLN